MARKKYEDDDGRVIASMNVAGMPWSDPLDNTVPGSAEEADRKRKQYEQRVDLDRGETASIIWGAMKAGMLIVLVFGIGGILTVLGFLYWRDIIGWIGGLFH